MKNYFLLTIIGTGETDDRDVKIFKFFTEIDTKEIIQSFKKKKY